MALTKIKARKGLLLTLATIVIVVLLVGELITYELINVDYSEISGQAAVGLAPALLASQVSGGINGYLSSALPQAFSIIAVSSPKIKVAGFYRGTSSSANVVSTASVSNFGNAISMFAWVWPAGARTSIVQKQGSYGMSIGAGGASAGQFNAYIGASGRTCTAYPFSLPNTTWSFVGFTYNGSYIDEYVNGVLYCTAQRAGTVPANTNQLFFSSSGSGNSDGPTYGYLSNVQLYNTALEPNAVALLFGGGPEGSALQSGNLVGWWPLNGNFLDMSGGGNNAGTSGVSFATSIVSNSSSAKLITKLIGNGTVFGAQSNLTSNTLVDYIAKAKQLAAQRQTVLDIRNSSLSAHQYSRGYVAITYSALLVLNTTTGSYASPVAITATLSTLNTLDYITPNASQYLWTIYSAPYASSRAGR